MFFLKNNQKSTLLHINVFFRRKTRKILVSKKGLLGQIMFSVLWCHNKGEKKRNLPVHHGNMQFIASFIGAWSPCFTDGVFSHAGLFHTKYCYNIMRHCAVYSGKEGISHYGILPEKQMR